MINDPVSHETPFPPSASAGGDNAYYLKGCDTVQRSPSYAACLFKISEIKAGRENDYNRECAGAVRSRQCRAVDLQEEEKLKGQALYFFPRRLPPHLPFKVAGDFGVPITNLTDPASIPFGKKAPASRITPVIKAKSVDVFDKEADDGSFASVINAAIADLAPTMPAVKPAAEAVVPKPKPSPAPTTRVPMELGETPLQYARRLAALKTPA